LANVVSDISGLVTLKEAAMLDGALSGSISISVADFVLEREFAPEQCTVLIKRGLDVRVVGQEGMELARSYVARDPGIGFGDGVSVALAKISALPVMSVEEKVRRLAESESIECHNIMWLLDQLEADGMYTPEMLQVATTALLRARTPAVRDEAKARIEKYHDRIRKEREVREVSPRCTVLTGAGSPVLMTTTEPDPD
jgi:hypothetical protein